MPRQPRRPVSQSEYFRFAVDEWNLEYGLHMNASHRPGDPLGRCWETHDIVLSGPLRSKTKRRCERVVLTIGPRAFDPKQWKPDWKGFGGVVGIQDGALTGYAHLPTTSFQTLLTGLAAGKVRGATISVDDFARGGGVITALFTTDPDRNDAE